MKNPSDVIPFWLPGAPQELDMLPAPREWGRTKPTAQEDVNVVVIARAAAMMSEAQILLRRGQLDEAKPLIEGLLARGALRTSDRITHNNLMATAVGAEPFCPAAVEYLETLGFASGLNDLPHKAWDGPPFQGVEPPRIASEHLDANNPFSLWSGGNGAAWAYALDRAQGSGTYRALQKRFAQLIGTINHCHQDARGASPHNAQPHRIEVLWEHAPMDVRRVIRAAGHSGEQLAQYLMEAVLNRNELLTVLLLDPQKMGTPITVAALMSNQKQTNMVNNVANFRWLRGVLEKNPACAATWAEAYPLKATSILYGTDWEQTKRFLGMAYHVDNKSETVTVDFVGHLIVGHHANMVMEMTRTAQGRAAIVRSALDNPYVLFKLLATHAQLGVDEMHLLAWGGEEVRAWRDRSGCCLAHYAVAVQHGDVSRDRILTRMINLVPEWRHAVRVDGVSLLSLFADPEAGARASRKEMNEVTRDSRMEKPSMASLPKRRM